MSLQNLVGQTLDNKYLIERELGKGGMGAVYFATHIGTERPVAVKVIVPEYMERPEFVERFRREARAAGRLRHPNVVDVTDFGIADTSDGRMAYLVMEYLDGCTLGEVLAEEKNLPLGWTLDILEQVCSAVHEAHQQGIIHRDLKPDNIWLEPNQRGGYTVKVLDFGIAKLETTASGYYHSEENGGAAIGNVRGTHAGLKNITLGDGLQTQTFGGVDAAATISQTPTVADKQDTQIQAAEAGTLIQPIAQVDSEGGTVILPDKNKTNVLDNDGTKLLSRVPSGEGKADTMEKNSADLTRVGSVLGTPLYMSPEQCRGEKLDPRSDIYSLAVIAYQMLSGKTPFEGQFTEVMLAHQEKAPPLLDVKKIPRKVKKVIYAGLEKSADSRPQSAESFASKMRASSEGLSELIRRGLIIYSQHFSKFLLVSFLILLPLFILNATASTFDLLRSVDVIQDFGAAPFISGTLGFISFFVQVFSVAFLIGMVTWIVAQILAVPLRPVNLRFALAEAKSKWKPLFTTTLGGALVALFSWVVGFILGGIVSLIIALPIGIYVSPIAGIAIGISLALLGSVALFIYISGRFMLITPSIMIENIRGKAAFKRSAELSKRSLRTVLGMSFLLFFVPVVLALAITASIGGLVRAFNPDKEKPAVEVTESKKADGPDFNFSIKPGGVEIEEKKDTKESEEEKKKTEKRQQLTGSIFELLWLPIVLFMYSFTSVITALLYFKTRQAGGESMTDLLEKFESADRPRSNWQQKVKNRLIQSGRQTSNPD